MSNVLQTPPEPTITVYKAWTIRKPKKLRPWVCFANGQPIMLPLKSGGASQLSVYALNETAAIERATKTYQYLTTRKP